MSRLRSSMTSLAQLTPLIICAFLVFAPVCTAKRHHRDTRNTEAVADTLHLYGCLVTACHVECYKCQSTGGDCHRGTCTGDRCVQRKEIDLYGHYTLHNYCEAGPYIANPYCKTDRHDQGITQTCHCQTKYCNTEATLAQYATASHIFQKVKTLRIFSTILITVYFIQ